MFFFRKTLTLLDLHIPEDPADSVVPVLKPIDLGKEPEPAHYKAWNVLAESTSPEPERFLGTRESLEPISPSAP